jgi:phosphopantetheine attachment domain protein
MTHDNIYDIIIEALSEHVESGSAELKPTTSFEMLDLDSLVLLEIVVAVEQSANIELPDDLLSADQTIEEAVESIKAYIK